MIAMPSWSGGIASELGSIPIMPAPGPVWALRVEPTSAEAEAFLTGIEAEPVRAGSLRDMCVAVTMTDPDTQLAACREMMTRCNRLGIRVAVGLELCNEAGHTRLANSWCNPEVWIERAAWLDAIVSSLRALWTEDVIYLDVRSEHGLVAPDSTALYAEGLSAVQLEVAMRPFLTSLSTANLTPFIYPNASTRDLAQPLMTRAAGGVGVIALDAFESEDLYRRSGTDYWQYCGELLERFDDIRNQHAQQVQITIGARDGVLRRWSQPFQRDYSSLSERAGFLLPHVADLSQAGSEAWLRGTTLNTANDPQFVWHCPRFYNENIERSFGLSPSTTLFAHTGLLTSTSEPNDDPEDPVAAFDGGIRLLAPSSTAFRLYRGNAVMPTSAVTYPNGPRRWGVRVNLRLPRDPNSPTETIGSHGLFSQCPQNLQVWQVFYDRGADEIRLMVNPTTDRLILSNPPREETISIFIGRDLDTWSWVTNLSSHGTTTNATMSSWEHLLIGSGQRLSSPGPPPVPIAFGTNNNCDGMPNLLLVDDVVVWHRALSQTEAEDVVVGTWPWLTA